jgi:hypothetical protein
MQAIQAPGYCPDVGGGLTEFACSKIGYKDNRNLDDTSRRHEADSHILNGLGHLVSPSPEVQHIFNVGTTIAAITQLRDPRSPSPSYRYALHESLLAGPPTGSKIAPESRHCILASGCQLFNGFNDRFSFPTWNRADCDPEKLQRPRLHPFALPRSQDRVPAQTGCSLQGVERQTFP